MVVSSFFAQCCHIYNSKTLRECSTVDTPMSYADLTSCDTHTHDNKALLHFKVNFQKFSTLNNVVPKFTLLNYSAQFATKIYWTIICTLSCHSYHCDDLQQAHRKNTCKSSASDINS